MSLYKIIILLLSSMLFSTNASTNYSQLSYGLSSGKNKVEKPRITVKQHDVISGMIDEDEYIVGPGDIFLLDIANINLSSEYSLIVTATEDVLIPLVGNINVSKLTLSETFSLIGKKCRHKYADSQINLILYKAGKFKINISGSYDINLDFEINSLTRLSELIYEFLDRLNRSKAKNADWVSLRNICIVRDEDTLRFDLEKYKYDSEYTNNPYLRRDDMILIKHYNDNINISGGVNRPRRYEILNDEYLYDLLMIAGGLSEGASGDSIQIFRKNINENNFITLSIDETKKFIVEDDDNIIVRLNNFGKRINYIELFGEFKYPGLYMVEYGLTTVSDIIRTSGGFTQYSDSTRLLLYHTDYIEMQNVRLSVSKPLDYISQNEVSWMEQQLENPITRNSHLMYKEDFSEYSLMPGDRLEALPLMDYIEIIGAVKKPGRYNFADNYTAANYLSLAGGYSANANRNLYLIKFGTYRRIPISTYADIEKGDIIFVSNNVETSKWYRFKDWMLVVSQIATLVVLIQNIIE